MGKPHDIIIVRDAGHWRWICSCGRKGMRLFYRQSVERLAAIHLQKAVPAESHSDTEPACDPTGTPDNAIGAEGDVTE